MANAYSAGLFTIDTSTNVAGLTALKGSACALTDDICVSGNSCPTMTIEASLVCKSMNIGYGAVGAASPGQGNLVQDDNTVLTFAASGNLNIRKGAAVTLNGALRTVGTSDGTTADQTYAQLHADNTTVYIDEVAWQWRPALTGECVAVTASTNTTSITCTTDPRKTGLWVGATVDIRTRSTGALIASKVVSAYTATTVSWASGNVSVTANESVYLPIASTEKVYTCSGGNIVFGDGNASAYNNNGGAIPANGALIQQNGITWTCATPATGYRWNTVSGTLSFTHVDFAYLNISSQRWGSHLYNCSNFLMHGCSFHGGLSSGLYASYGCNGWTISGSVTCYSNTSYGLSVSSGCNGWTISGSVTCYGNTSYGFNVSYGCNDWAISGSVTCYGNTSYGFNVSYGCNSWRISGSVTCYGNTSYGFNVSYGCNDWTISGSVTCYSNASYGFYVNAGCNNWTVSGNITCYSNASYGLSIQTGCNNWRILSSPRLWGNSNNTVFIDSSTGFAAARGQTGAAGTISWRCHESTSPVGYAHGAQVRLPTKNAYHESAQVWVPGMAAYGAATVTVTQVSSSTTSTQFRRSGDGGKTWTTWTDVPTSGNMTADTPDANNEWLQFRVAKSDAGAGIPQHSGISLVVTMTDNFTFDTAKAPPMAKITSAGSPIGCRFIRGMGLR